MAFMTLGNNKRFYLVLTAVLIIAVVYQLKREAPPEQPAQSLQPMPGDRVEAQAVSDKTNSEVAPAPQTKATPDLHATPEAKLSSAEAIAVAPDAWSMGDATTAIPTMRIPEGVSVYEPVSVDMENPAYPAPGERLSLAMPGGEHLQVNIETSSTNPNGDYTWRGHLDGYGDEYPVVMTYGGNSVFATVTTPKGSYTLESVNGSGWIYKNPSEFELSNPGTKDYLDIPHAHE